MFDKIKKYFERIGIDVSNETKKHVDETTVLEVGLQIYYDQTIMKLIPSFSRLVKVLDGRITRNAISKALDYLEDMDCVIRNVGTEFQYGLTENGIDFLGQMYKKVIITD